MRRVAAAPRPRHGYSAEKLGFSRRRNFRRGYSAEKLGFSRRRNFRRRRRYECASIQAMGTRARLLVLGTCKPRALRRASADASGSGSSKRTSTINFFGLISKTVPCLFVCASPSSLCVSSGSSGYRIVRRVPGLMLYLRSHDSGETRRGDAAAATWIFRGDGRRPTQRPGFDRFCRAPDDERRPLDGTRNNRDRTMSARPGYARLIVST